LGRWQKRDHGMNILSKELVQKTQHQLSLLSDEHARKEIKKIGKKQPHLFSFIEKLIKDLDDHLTEAFIKILLAVYTVYSKGRRRIHQISEEELSSYYLANVNLFKSMETAHRRFFEKRIKTMISVQPYLLEYVLDALNETIVIKPGSDKHQEDCGYLYLLIKTIIDVLEEKTR
jgi:hypothetical protein